MTNNCKMCDGKEWCCGAGCTGEPPFIMKSYLSANVCSARNVMGLTMMQLAKDVGVSQGFISKLESGRYDKLNISANVLVKLSQVLDLSIHDLLFTPRG